MKAILTLLALSFITATLLPLLRNDQWWIRIFDFPRAQIAVGGIVLIAAFLLWGGVARILDGLVLAGLVLCIGYQLFQMLPYTPLFGKQVLPAEASHGGAGLSLLIANVLMTNHEADAFLELVRTRDPDVILTVETDGWWEERLRVLESDYPYTVKHPLENTYGMLLYSRLELVGAEVKFLIRDDIPSMHTQVRLADGRLIWLHGLHPEPPYPKEAEQTTERDAELLLVGREVKERNAPALVAGDLNDVAWSYTTKLFQQISGLLDPRVGRGMYNTFSAHNPLLRWPLDHVFHSDHFKLVQLERLPAFGSDHFPVFIELNMEPEAPAQQEEPEPDQEDQQRATEKIEKAEPKESL